MSVQNTFYIKLVIKFFQWFVFWMAFTGIPTKLMLVVKLG